MTLIIYIYIPAHISPPPDIARIYTPRPPVASHHSSLTHHGGQRWKKGAYMAAESKCKEKIA